MLRSQFGSYQRYHVRFYRSIIKFQWNKFIFWLLLVTSVSTGASNEIQQHRNLNLLPAYRAFHWLVHTKLVGISYCFRLMVMDQPTWHLVSFINRNQEKSINSCYKICFCSLLIIWFIYSFIKWTENVDATIKLIPKVETRKGKKYMRVSQLLLNFDTTR